MSFLAKLVRKLKARLKTQSDLDNQLEGLFLKSQDIQNKMSSQRKMFAEGVDIDAQMSSLMSQEETEEYEKTMSTDEDMEEGYLDFILDEALEDEEETYLMEQLENNDRLSLIFDRVIDVATEFSGSGPVNGPGSGVSDSIPARLSDGEFVFTTKATAEIGADNLEAMMKDAEAAVDGRQMAYAGGSIKEEKEVMAAPKEPQQQNINVTKTTLDNGAVMSRKQEDLVGKAVKENMMLDPYQRHVRS